MNKSIIFFLFLSLFFSSIQSLILNDNPHKHIYKKRILNANNSTERYATRKLENRNKSLRNRRLFKLFFWQKSETPEYEETTSYTYTYTFS